MSNIFLIRPILVGLMSIGRCIINNVDNAPDGTDGNGNTKADGGKVPYVLTSAFIFLK